MERGRRDAAPHPFSEDRCSVAVLSGHRVVPNAGTLGGEPGELGRNSVRRNDGRIESLPGCARDRGRGGRGDRDRHADRGRVGPSVVTSADASARDSRRAQTAYSRPEPAQAPLREAARRTPAMQQKLTPEGLRLVTEIAARHGVSVDAALSLLGALAQGHGAQAQFNHPDLGGMGQWSQGGMIMIGDMFNSGLNFRVDALCNELAGLLRSQPFAEAATLSVAKPRRRRRGQPVCSGNRSERRLVASRNWARPASTGAQNDMRYAWFPGSAPGCDRRGRRGPRLRLRRAPHLRVLPAAGGRPVADVHQPVRRRAPGRPAPGFAARRARSKFPRSPSASQPALARRPPRACVNGRSRPRRRRWRTSSRRSSGLRSCVRKTFSPKKNFRRRRRSCSAACSRPFASGAATTFRSPDAANGRIVLLRRAP